MTTDTKLATRSAMSFEPANLVEAYELAKRLCQTGVVPDTLRNKPDDTLATMLVGHELGLKPMQSFRSIHLVKGRPVMAAELMLALCLASPMCEEFRLVESTDKVAKYSATRRGQKPVELSWTIDMAKRAGLLDKNPTWKAHPEAMLRARCVAALARATFPDLLLGVCETSEGKEMERGDSEAQAVESMRAEVKVEIQKPAEPKAPETQKALPPAHAQPAANDELSAEVAAIRADIKKAAKIEDVTALVPRIQKLPEAERVVIREEYSKRKTELAQAPKMREPGED